MALEHAFQHQACKRGLLALRMPNHLLDVEARPARCRDRIAAETESVNADWKSRFFRRLVDRPIAALTQRLDIAAQQQDLDETLVSGALADFGGSGRAVFIGDHHRAFRTEILPGPLSVRPVF